MPSAALNLAPGWSLLPRCLGAWLLGAGIGAAAIPAVAAEVQVQVTNGQSRPVPDAVVFLESKEARAAVKPGTGVAVVQRNKQFVPMVSVVTVGSAVAFPNLDTVRHHVYSFSPAKTFELKLYAGTPANPVVFDRTGVAVLGCNIHDAMTGWVVVVETPYFGRADDEGTVRLTQVPPGSYRLRTWATTLPMGAPALDQPITVGPEGSTARVRLDTGT